MKKCIVFISMNTKKEGAEKSLISLQKYLINSKNIKTITIIPENGKIEELLKENNIEYMICNFRNCINLNKGKQYIKGNLKKIYNQIQAKKLAKKLKKYNIQIVHTNTLTTDFGYYLAKELNAKHIWHIRELAKKQFNFDFELGNDYIIKCVNQSSKIICNSESVKEYYSNYFDKSKIICVYNGVSTAESGKEDWNNPKFKMVLAGRLSSEKCQMLAIKACKILKESNYNNFILDLYGDGIDKDILEKNIIDLNLEKYIKLKGFSDNVPFKNYHLGLMCSSNEAFGRVTVEYMMNSLPVIGANSFGTKEIIKDNISGYLFNVDDAKDLADKIMIFYNNRKLCQKMGKEGRKIALRNFSENSYCENIYKIYQKIFLEE